MNMMTAIVPAAETVAVPTWQEWRAKVEQFRQRIAEDEAAQDRADAVPSTSPDHDRLLAEQDVTCEAGLKAERDLYSTPAPSALALREKMEIFRDYGIGGDGAREHMRLIIDDARRLCEAQHESTSDPEWSGDYSILEPAGPSAIAFMRAFEERQSSGFEGDRSFSKAEFQFNEFAYQGAMDMIVQASIEDAHSAAIVSIVAFELISAVLADFYQNDDFQRHHDEKDALLKVLAALRNLWAFSDRQGGSFVRRYAEWIELVDDADRARWAREG